MCEDSEGNPLIIPVKNVLFVPVLKENLISVKRLTEQDFEVTFTKGTCAIKHKDKVIVKADLCGDLFKLRQTDRALTVKNQHSHDCQHAWHRKLGHRDFEAIKMMVSKGIAKGIVMRDCGLREVCDTCTKGKMARKPFPQKSESKSNSILQLIHTDVCGPMQTMTPGQNRYILTLIDDYSRYTTIYLLSQKSEVTERIQNFVQEVKMKFGIVPKVFRSDRGTEYINKDLKDFFRKEGIRNQYTVSYTPEQNGVAERKNRSLLEMTRCLLIDAKLEKKYWGEAVYFANYLQNRLVTKATSVTPIERWCGMKPDLKDMHIFGSKVYAHVPKELRRKLDDKAKEYRFAGYDEHSKGYRLLDTNTNKIVISRDVKFTDSTDGLNQDEGISTKVDEKDDGNHLNIRLSNDAIVRMEANEADRDDTEDEIEDNTEYEIDDNIEGETSTVTKRGRGRPRTIRTGARGRPRKVYSENTENFAGYATEVPMDIAISGKDANEWLLAMVSEVKSMLEKDVWDLVERPQGKNVIDSRMVLTNKYGSDGTVSKRKARLVARRPGMDFSETFAPVARLSSIRLAAALAAHYGMSIHQVDIATAYLNGSLNEEIYMEVPGNIQNVLKKIIDLEQTDSQVEVVARKMLKQLQSGNKVCKLKKAIYGLKQAGRQWHTRLDEELRTLGLQSSNFDPCVYRFNEGEDLLLVIVYVDDILILSRNLEKIQRIKDGLTKAFSSVKDLGNVKYCLGIEFSINKGEVKLSQKMYIKKLLEKFNMTEANPVKVPLEPGTALIKEDCKANDKQYPYRELIGGLMYLSIVSRPDISYAVSYLSQFNNCYGKAHWEAAKRVLRYIKGTDHYCLTYRSGNSSLKGFADADWGGCINDRRSFTGYVFHFCGCPISWESRKQRTVALSTTEAEYVAITDAAKEAIYLMDTFLELGVKLELDITVYNDNASALKLSKNPVFHARTKHIAIRHHFIKEVLCEGKFKLKYLRTNDMVADVLTKALSGPKHIKCVKELGLVN